MASADTGNITPITVISPTPVAVPAASLLAVTRPSFVAAYTASMSVVTSPPEELTVVNQGFELGDTTGWTFDAGSGSVNSQDSCEGTYSITPADGSILRQDVILTASQLTKVSAGEYFALLRFCIGAPDFSYSGVKATLRAYAGTTFLQEFSTNDIACASSRTVHGFVVVLPLPTTTTQVSIVFTWNARGYPQTTGVGHTNLYLLHRSRLYPYMNAVLSNSGAETGTVANWYTENGQTLVVDAAYTPAHSGNYCFSLRGPDSNAAPHGRFSQYFTLSTAEQAVVAAGGHIELHIATKNGAASTSVHQKLYPYVKAYSSSGAEVASVSAGLVWSSDWTTTTLTLSSVPPDTLTLVVYFDIWTDQTRAADRGIYLDSVSYDVLPLTTPAVRERKRAAYSVIAAPKTLKAHADKAYALIKERISFEATKFNAYMLQYVPERAATFDLSAYSVLGDPFTYAGAMISNALLSWVPSSNVSVTFNNAILRPAKNADVSTTLACAVMSNPNYKHLFAYNLKAYCAFQYTPPVVPTSAYLYDSNAYAAIKRVPKLTAHKATGYCVWYPDPMLRTPKTLSYAVIKESDDQLNLWDHNAYALMVFEGDMRVRDANGYAVITRMPPLREYKNSAYGIIARPGYIKQRAQKTYAALYVTRLRANRELAYAVLPANNIETKKTANYVLLHTDEVFRARVQKGYAALQHVTLPTNATKVTSYAVLGGTTPLTRVRDMASYCVIGERQPIIKATNLSSYLLVAPYPTNKALTHSLTTYIVFKDEYTRTFSTASYAVLATEVPWYIKQYKMGVYLVRGIPAEQPNATYSLIQGKVQ